MDKKVISLMRQNIKSHAFDLNQLKEKDCDEIVNFLHHQYDLADQQLKQKSRF